MTWDNPHWSGRPQHGAVPRQRLRPNLYARIARFCASHGSIIVLFFAVLAMVCGSYAASTLRIDPDQRPLVTLDDKTASLQAELDRQFPGIEQTFLAQSDSSDPVSARQQAMALAAALTAREDLFLSAFVPGTGAFYDRNALLFRNLDQVRARVDSLILLEPLHYALASAPSIVGFASLVNEIGKAVAQGRSPPGLEALLLAASATIESEVRGRPQPVNWVALAGLDGELESTRWFVLATPRPGLEPEAAAAARQASQGMQGVSWLWPRRALATSANPLRDFVVPACLAVFLVMLLTAAVLGSVRQMLAIMLGAGVTLSCAAAAAAAMGRPLDGASWPFALAVLAPVFVSGSFLCTSFAACRAKGVSITQSIMLASQRQGELITAGSLLFAAIWGAWLLRQLPSLSQFAAIALIACAVAWLVSLTLLPAALSVVAARRPADAPHWLDEMLGSHDSFQRRTVNDALAMIVLAVAIFCAVFLPAVRFGERQLPSNPPPMLETPDARGAIHVLAQPDQVDDLVLKLSGLPELGTIRTATQFLPPQSPEKIAELQRLAALTPFEPAFGGPANPTEVNQSFAELEEQLTAIAVGPATSPALKEAALRLRRSLMLFMAPTPPDLARVAELERSLFGGLGQLSALTEQLARLDVPTVASLDPRLLRRFVSEQGIWRIEVMPREGIGELSFAAAIRRVVPQAAGEPLVSLARNEVIHHETIMALAVGLALAAFIALAALRSVTAWIITLVPTAAFITLSAAVGVIFHISINSSMLAGLSAAIAVLMVCGMRVAGQLVDPSRPSGGFRLSLRAAFLPPLALAGAVAPLAVSSRPSVAEVGGGLALLLLVVAVLNIMLVPAMARWIDTLMGRSPRYMYRR